MRTGKIAACGLLLSLVMALNGAADSPIANVSIAPSFFNPTVGQSATITFRAAVAGTARVTILDRDRFVIRTLAPVAVQPGVVTVMWDGRDDRAAIAWDAWGVLQSATGDVPNPLGYTAREKAEGGLQFYRGRYYEPRVGRFLSEDLVSTNSVSHYSYVANDPVSFTDPTGAVVYLPDPVPKFVPGTQDETMKRCGHNHRARACSQAFVDFRCHCTPRCEGGVRFIQAEIYISVRHEVYYRSDEPNVGLVKTQEKYHQNSDRAAFDEGAERAANFGEKLRFPSVQECQWYCKALLAGIYRDAARRAEEDHRRNPHPDTPEWYMRKPWRYLNGHPPDWWYEGLPAPLGPTHTGRGGKG